MAAGRTLFDKVWQDHVVVAETADTPAVLYIDLHLIHEVTTPQAFTLLRERGLAVRRPDLTLATMDHSTPTTPVTSFRDLAVVGESAAKQIRQMEQNCRDFGIDLIGFGNAARGIVHVIGPELGATQPGKTIVCGDSHTSTHGAFGALAFGIGTTEVGHVLATQCLLQRRPKTLAINVSGRLAAGVTSKDLVLAIIGRIGVDGGTGHVIEYRGEAIAALGMDARMTICNMSIEAGARAGLIAPDDTTIEYLYGRPRAPQGADWDRAVARWRRLVTDADASFDRSVDIDASRLEPMVTFGTNPGMVIGVNEVVPGSQQIKLAAEKLGLDRVFVEAGAEWREPGCSMCLGMNGDTVGKGQLSVSTSNRNFEGRQGIGARTVLASPMTAAASALAGRIRDPRTLLQ